MMLHRWCYRLINCSAGLAIGLGISQFALSQRTYDGNQAERMLDLNTVELRDQLRNGLRVVTPEQDHFLSVVLAAVESKRLPRAMINVIYLWSLEKNPRVPFPYFQFAIRVLAARRGVSI